MTGWWSRLGVALVLGFGLAASPVPAFADICLPVPSSPSVEVSPSAPSTPVPDVASPTCWVSGPLDANDRGLVLDWMSAMAWGLGLTVLASSAGVVLLVKR